MIPIAYTGVISAYDKFCQEFHKKLEKVITQGYIGNRAKTTVKEAKVYYQTLTPEQKSLFDKHVGNGKKDWKVLSDTTNVLAPVEMLDAESMCAIRLYWVLFDEIVNAKDDIMQFLMPYYRLYMIKAKDRQKVYANLKSLLIDYGYEKQLPKEALFRAINARVCPYCNRVFVEAVDGTTKTVKGQLDHFYPKEKYPFLALSKYNLVPSCTYCNGPTGKHNADPRIEHLVNPHFMKDSRGLVFRANVPRRGFLNLKTLEKAIDIELDTSGIPNMDNNIRIFNLDKLYDTHKDYAAEVYYKYMKMKSKAYRDFATRMTRPSRNPARNVVLQIPFNDWLRLILGVYIKTEEQANRPLSKFVADLYDDFRSKGY